jgi:hypothetical protein
MEGLRSGAIRRGSPDELACGADQFGVMAAYQHQSFAGTIQQDPAHLLGAGGIQECRGFI